MAANDHPRFTIVGAGLGGALMATYLGQAGYEVEVYERRPDPRGRNAVGGRSINLALSTRGIHALEEVGVATEIMKAAIPMRGRMIHSPTGALSFQPYDKDPSKCINSISRAGLNVALIQAADASANVRLHFDRRCVGVDVERPAVRLERAAKSGTGGQTSGSDSTIETDDSGAASAEVHETDIVLSADGAFSAVRGSMQRLDRFTYSQTYLAHGYKELCIPPTAAGDFALEPNALHIWPRESFMMIALPNPDRTFTCTLFLAFEGPLSFAALASDDATRRFFETQFPDAVSIMPTLLDDFRSNPTGSLATIRSEPWYYRDKVALLGDACHAVVPFYGQGMNCTFEDCSVLNECLKQHAPDWEAAFRAYYQRRKRNADAIADLAVANFVEMRDQAGSRVFRIKKGLERMLHRFVPGYVPLYSMVSFSRVPYADAVARARRQDRLVAAVAVVLALLVVVVLGIMVWPKSH